MSPYQRVIEQIRKNAERIAEASRGTLAPPPTTIEAHCESSQEEQHRGADSVLDYAVREQMKKRGSPDGMGST
jgi:hypothetical protein